LHLTPVFSSRYLSERSGAEVWLKAELFQKTGSFKPRGAINRLKHLSPEEKARGIVSVSAGNHAQAVAFAAAREGISCVVVMPSTAPQNKLSATRNYGAEVVLHDDLRTIFERTEEVRQSRNATFVHPYDDPDVIAGQGTVGLEVCEQIPGADIVVAGIGGGALLAGIAVACKSLNPQVRVIGVEPEGAAGMTLALREGKPVRLQQISTVADGLAAPYAGAASLELVRRYVDDVVLVTDDQILDACRILLERAKLLAEPAGAACAAALLSGKIDAAGRKVALVVSGGNLDMGRLKSYL
ncbi:MAG TPA: threonine/serine dehydratase, partial [Acidobacteriota bacterium]|nr:threonine/serine dehydratase [Acidobacteriota bacterium]